MFEDKMDEQRKDIRQIVGEFVRNLKHGKRCDFVRYVANEKHESFDKWTRRLAAWSEGNFSGKPLTEEECHQWGKILATYKSTHINI